MIGAKEAIAISEIQRQLTTFLIFKAAHSLAFDRVFYCTIGIAVAVAANIHPKNGTPNRSSS